MLAYLLLLVLPHTVLYETVHYGLPGEEVNYNLSKLFYFLTAPFG
jgi:hypothetical protein